MKKWFAVAMFSMGAVFVVSCGEGGIAPIPKSSNAFLIEEASEKKGLEGEDKVIYPQKKLSGIINNDLTLTKDTVWILNGTVVVGKGTTLTIDAGTILKGTPGQGALASVLLVARGAVVNANGTASEPIVMTSLKDHINVKGSSYYDGTAIRENSDGFTSCGLDPATDTGLWGGFILLGNAPISSGDGVSTSIEGIPSSVAQATFGGTNVADNSGSVTYVSIRFTGTQLGPGNELQGLTLGGVGSGTTIDYVESIASADDGIEIFGGAVNIDNIIVWGQEDDGYDADMAWTGTLNNFVYIGSNEDADHALELDGPEGTTNGGGHFTNGTLYGLHSTGMAEFRDDASYVLDRLLFFGFTEDADIELHEDNGSEAYFPSINYVTDNTTRLTHLQFTGNTKTTLEEIMDAKDFGSLETKDQAKPEYSTDQTDYAARADKKFAEVTHNNRTVASTTEATVGADITNFGWSYTSRAYAGWRRIPNKKQ